MKTIDVGTVFDAGVDYLTVTIADKRNKELAASRGLRILGLEEKAGFDLLPWAMYGFQGYRCGGMQMGDGQGRVIVRLSGEVAKRHWRKFAQLSDNCSRLDLQVTVRYEMKATTAIARAFRQTKRNKHDDGKNRTVSLYQSSNGSSTIYVGNRTTENYGRIYAKGMETKLPHWDNSVRFEAEYKGDQANRELFRLVAAPNEVVHVFERLTAFFHMRGCRPSWNLECGPQTAVNGVIQTVPNCDERRTRITDRARRLTWLAKSVRLCVEQLVADGCLAQVLEALGLPQCACSSRDKLLAG